MEYKIIVLCVCICLFACTFSSSRKNASADIDKAKIFCREFYLKKQKREFIDISKRADEKYLDSAELKSILTSTDATLGRISSFEFDKAISKITLKGGEETGIYQIYYKCKYENGQSNENFSLFSSDSGMVISDYKVNLDSLD
jgi:hypothetical protein